MGVFLSCFDSAPSTEVTLFAGSATFIPLSPEAELRWEMLCKRFFAELKDDKNYRNELRFVRQMKEVCMCDVD